MKDAILLVYWTGILAAVLVLVPIAIVAAVLGWDD